MPAFTLIRTVAAPILADPDWGADPLLSPSDGIPVPPGTTKAGFVFRAFNAAGVEISHGDMTLDFTVVAELAYMDESVPPRPKAIFREFKVTGGLIEARGAAVETDLPVQSVRLFPRMRGVAVNPPATIDSLKIYGGVW